VCVYFFLWS